MTNKPLIAGLSGVALAAVLWSMPATAGMGNSFTSSVRYAHDKWPAFREAAESCVDDSGHNDGDHDCDDPSPRVGAPEPGTLVLLALGLGGIGLRGNRRRASK